MARKKKQKKQTAKKAHFRKEGVDFIYKPSGTKSPTKAIVIKHFATLRHGCECEEIDGRIHVIANSGPTIGGSKGRRPKSGGLAKSR